MQSPAIDGIAAEGVRFTNAYTNGPVCVPARLSLATGRYPHEHRVWDNRKYTLSPKSDTWMGELKSLGYRTSVWGKTHLYPQKGDLRDQEYLLHGYGLDDVDEVAGPKSSLASKSNLTELWREAGVYKAFKKDLKDRSENKPWIARPSPLPLELYPDVYVGRRAAEYLEGYAHDQPWFCWVSFPGPHEPWDAPDEYADRYDPAAMPPPLKPIESRGNVQGFLQTRLLDQMAFEEGDVGRLRANYAGNISLIDDQVAKVLRAVEARGELDNTMIVFASDHGEMNGDHGLIKKKTFLNGAVRIPLIMRLPTQHEGAARGAVSSSLVELIDIGATLVDIAGGKLPKQSHAQSVVPVLGDPSLEHRSEAVSGLKKEIMVATKDWRLAINREGEPYMLVDLKNDPDETLNLAGDPAYDDVIAMLLKQLKESDRDV